MLFSNSLYIITAVILIFLTDLGCNAGSSLSCSNKGICETDGTCRCKNGYFGNSCLGTSYLFFEIGIKIDILIILFLI